MASLPPKPPTKKGPRRPPKFFINVDRSQTSVPFKDDETLKQVLDRVCKDKGLDFKKMEVVIPGTSTSPPVDLTLAAFFDKFGVGGVNFVPAVVGDRFHVVLDGNVTHLLSYDPTSTLESVLRTVATERSLVFEHYDTLMKGGTPITDLSITLGAYVSLFNTREVSFLQNANIKFSQQLKAQEGRAATARQLNLSNMTLEPKLQSSGKINSLKDVNLAPLNKTIENMTFASGVLGKDSAWNDEAFWGNLLK